MRIADTSMLYALFSRNDIHHAEAMQAMRDPEEVFIPSEIWCETISLIHCRRGFEMAVEAGSALHDLPHVELLPSRVDVIRASWKTYMEASGELSFTDSIVVSWCMDRRAQPLTCDDRIKGWFEAHRRS